MDTTIKSQTRIVANETLITIVEHIAATNDLLVKMIQAMNDDQKERFYSMVGGSTSNATNIIRSLS